MQFLIDDQTISDSITESEFAAYLKNIPADQTVTLLLADNETVLQFDGSAASGYRASTTHLASNETIYSTNKALKPITLRRAAIDFINGNIAWRSQFGWERASLTLNSQQKQFFRKAAPVFIFLLVFAFGYAPLAILTRVALDEIYFEPQCQALQPDIPVMFYSRGATSSATNLFDTMQRTVGMCWFDDYSSFPFSVVTGNERDAITIDRIADAITVGVPLAFMGVFLAIIVWWMGRRGRKSKTSPV